MKMKRIILFGSILAVFLMLMMPVSPTVEYQNQKNTFDSVKETINYANFQQMLEQKLKNKYPAVYYKYLYEQDCDCFSNDIVDDWLILFCICLFFLAIVCCILFLPLGVALFELFHQVCM